MLNILFFCGQAKRAAIPESCPSKDERAAVAEKRKADDETDKKKSDNALKVRAGRAGRSAGIAASSHVCTANRPLVKKK